MLDYTHLSDETCVYKSWSKKMKRTNIVIDEATVRQAMKLTGIKTKREVVNQALSDLVRRKGQKKILSLIGQFTWDGDLAARRLKRSF